MIAFFMIFFHVSEGARDGTEVQLQPTVHRSPSTAPTDASGWSKECLVEGFSHRGSRLLAKTFTAADQHLRDCRERTKAAKMALWAPG
mmetsp:Transcript_15483/g.25442  ORF Transcript_15483/g.25442 Transcript_15483/m.25442 type:complete len:88 (+) Transcript_15483:776-1039(+)